jgi:hypothetical protein
MMKNITLMSLSEKWTAISLIIAAVGVVIQILAGANYPPVPPVFFILLIPALLLMFVRQWWMSFIAVIAGVFLSIGLFISGSYTRLYHPNTLGDTVGLWIQTLAVSIVIISGMYTVIRNRPNKNGSSM